MTAKNVQDRDYLDAWGHFIFRFGAIGDKQLGGGGGNHPLGRRGLVLKCIRGSIGPIISFFEPPVKTVKDFCPSFL